MRLRVGGLDRSGRALDVREANLDAERVVRAVRDPADDRVRCPRPGPVHEHVGLVRAGVGFDRRATLAAVARSHGEYPPVLDDLDAARERLADHGADGTALRAARERAADATADIERLRERVAERRGEVTARREADLDAADARDRLRDAARALSEAATEQSAARQRLARERERARAGYDARAERLRLEDRVANLERDARGRLAERVAERFEGALADLTNEPEESEPRLRRLAAARVAVIAAPVVLTGGPFGDADAAAAWLGAPVLVL
ncbi:hypothetical protein [Halosegnis marinus]|uniref:Uncharacterized protein n=1 Tax=Halosegnis marinus TaxID=3034023 RepID=A0ABD5ZPS4_9EURY|nr:hypothetical protein [Halosegnis sp. DT85]